LEVGAKVVTSQHWKRQINPLDALAFHELFKLCRKVKFDIVHTHTSKGGFLGRIAARLAGVPVVIHTAHGFSFNEFTPRLTTTFYVCLEWIANHFCDTVISVTNQHRLMGIEKGVVKADKIVTIHNGIDLSRFTGATDTEGMRRKLGLSNQTILIGTVGRITPQKGQEYLLKALPFVLHQHQQIHVAFVGDGPQEAELRELALELGVAAHCSFLGFRRDVEDLLPCFDIFVQPSPREGLSITLLEAMAAMKPVVATNITGNREVITSGCNGVLCEPRDSVALAKALIDLIENQEKAQSLGKKAQEKVLQLFDEEMMLAKTLELYQAQIDSALALGRSLGCTTEQGDKRCLSSL
jgi:glycosyltransferase involved in cell wall biosynthesis